MTPFYKLSGAGNDFIALPEPSKTPTADEIRGWCRRRLSLGADGLFVVRREPGGVRMTHFEPDGSSSDLCLNGSRCAVRLAFELGWADERLTLFTDAGALAAERRGERIALALPDFVSAPRSMKLSVDGQDFEGWLIRVGVPHFVLSWNNDLRQAPVAEIGARIRSHPELAPEGANVNFARLEDDDAAMRTFERGVEAETLACGTGAVACAVVAKTLGRSTPFHIRTTSDDVLSIEERLDGLTLVGPARIVARGELAPP